MIECFKYYNTMFPSCNLDFIPGVILMLKVTTGICLQSYWLLCVCMLHWNWGRHCRIYRIYIRCPIDLGIPNYEISLWILSFCQCPTRRVPRR